MSRVLYGFFRYGSQSDDCTKTSYDFTHTGGSEQFEGEALIPTLTVTGPTLFQAGPRTANLKHIERWR